jgi:vitamin B12 transporter
MIDGVRVQSDSIGSLTQTDVPLSQIERIEILRGSAGALYGDAAVGGVINVYTRKGRGQMAPYGAVSYGTYNTRDVSVGYGGELDGKSLDLNAGSVKSDGFSSMNKQQNLNTNPAENGHSKNSASLRFEDKLTQSLRLGVRIATATSETSYDKNDANAYSLKTTNDTYSVYARQQVNHAWFSTLDLTHADLKYEDLKNGNPYPANSYTSSYLNGHQNAIRWGNVYEISNVHKASFGVDVLKDKYDTSGDYGYSIHRDTKGYYGGLTSTFDALTVQANLRRDQIDLDYTSGALSNSSISATSTLLGAGYQLNPAWKLTGTSSTGFRAPTAYDISLNASVKQEEFKSQEAGVVYADANTYGRMVYFKTATKNAIGYDTNYTTAYNIGETKVDGVEVNLRTNWRGHSVKLSAVHQNPWDVTDNKALERRARHYGSLDVSRPFGSYEVGSRLYMSGARYDTNYIPYPSQSVTLPGYSTWTFYASRKIDNEWTARMKLENAFERQYQLAYGYNTPGRGIYATLQYQPK